MLLLLVMCLAKYIVMFVKNEIYLLNNLLRDEDVHVLF